MAFLLKELGTIGRNVRRDDKKNLSLQLMKEYAFYVYITTNPAKTVLYIGMTNNLVRRLDEHHASRGQNEKFAGMYYCYNLVYWEFHKYVRHAIEREKEIKGWRRDKKIALIESLNSEWKFLNAEIQS